MNLVIDVGNTFIKLAVFDDGELRDKVTSQKKDFLKSFKELIKKHRDIKRCIVSSVGGLTKAQLAALKIYVPVFELSHSVNLPFSNKYTTPDTLGVDRIALISAAAVHFPDENVLVIDAGSCITYDFLTSKKNYLGGAISPGIEMRYKAMHSFTANLPLLDTKTPDKFIGDSTNNSIHIGVIQGVINEIEGFINRYIEKYTHLTVILTGGDAHFLRDSIKNDIFANSNFLLEGLNYILEINKD